MYDVKYGPDNYDKEIETIIECLQDIDIKLLEIKAGLIENDLKIKINKILSILSSQTDEL
jgi:hypothetical protein